MLRLSNEEGQTMAEYGLIIALVAAVVIVAVTVFGADLYGYWDSSVNTIANAIADATT